MTKPKALHPKVAAAGLGGMISTVLVWGLGKTGLQVPPDVAAAMAGLLMMLAAYRAPHDFDHEAHAPQALSTNGHAGRAPRATVAP